MNQGGLIPPNANTDNVAMYESWIMSGLMDCRTRQKTAEEGPPGCETSVCLRRRDFVALCSTYLSLTASAASDVMEWKISFELLEMAPGRPYSASDAETAVGINIGIGDVDQRTDASGCCGFHHQQWLSGGQGRETHPSEFGTLLLMPTAMP